MENFIIQNCGKWLNTLWQLKLCSLDPGPWTPHDNAAVVAVPPEQATFICACPIP